MSSLFHHKKEKKVEEQHKGDFSKLDDREATFRSQRWPSSLPAPDIMADAGYYFTPTDKNADCCTCYQCGIKMFNWLPTDNPKFEHRKFSSSCREVKSWTDLPTEEPDHINLNRAEQTEHHGKLRAKLADKAKRLAGGFHKKEDAPHPNGPLPSISKESSNKVSSPVAEVRELTEEEKLADVQRRREIAERSLEGLEKLAACYHQGSSEQKRAEESISNQRADLDKLRAEEHALASNMSNLSFGRTWNTTTTEAQTAEPLSPVLESDSPHAGRAQRRITPMLPSQMKKDAVPRMPAHLERANPAPLTKIDQVPSYEAPTYEAFTKSKENYNATEEPVEEQWITYYTDAGVPYYYSTLTKTTVWNIPTSLESLPPVASN